MGESFTPEVIVFYSRRMTVGDADVEMVFLNLFETLEFWKDKYSSGNA